MIFFTLDNIKVFNSTKLQITITHGGFVTIIVLYNIYSNIYFIFTSLRII